MLRQDELAFMMAISTSQVSPALLEELRLAVTWRKKPAVLLGEAASRPEAGPQIPNSS